ncbi:MAG: hypothetical protein ACEY26_00490 [Candidatus Hodgkinia cicadicola]
MFGRLRRTRVLRSEVRTWKGKFANENVQTSVGNNEMRFNNLPFVMKG